MPLLFDLSAWGWTQIEMTGRDRQSFLHGFCTNDIKRLTPGQGCEAFLSNIKGRIIGHIRAFADEGRLCLESEPGQAAAIIGHLDRYLIAEDVQLVDRSAAWGLLLLTGNGAGELLSESKLCVAPPQTIGDHVTIGDVDFANLRRSDITSELNWTISGSADAIEGMRSRLIAAGSVLSDHETFEAFRIEHGYPLFGVDLSEENLVHESGRVAQTVSFTKGCYLGQEPIARLDSLGHVNRHLCRLRIATSAPVGPGARVLQSDSISPPTPVGHLTSASHLDLQGPGITAAIAMVKREAAAAGASLLVELPDGTMATADVLA